MGTRGFVSCRPQYKERVWGGENLRRFLNRKIPEGRIGESWEIVDRDGDQSFVKIDGRTMSLRDFLFLHSRAVMGPRWNPKRPFPLLIKWLDCNDRLSVQVHPPPDVAALLGGEPKSEFWYIAHAHSEARIFAGLAKGVKRRTFEEALHKGNAEICMHEVKSRPGGYIYIPSGRIHAIDAGNIILEIQQNSDTTFRLWDWNRLGLDKKPRQLHVEQALRSVNFDDYEPEMNYESGGNGVLVSCDAFRITKFTLRSNAQTITFNAFQQPRLIHVIDGEIFDKNSGMRLQKGANAILPYVKRFEIRTISQQAVILITDNFV